MTLSQLYNEACLYNCEFAVWLKDRKNRRAILHRLENCGYVPVRNDADKSDGQWKIDGKRQTVYGRANLSTRDRLAAASKLTGR